MNRDSSQALPTEERGGQSGTLACRWSALEDGLSFHWAMKPWKSVGLPAVKGSNTHCKCLYWRNGWPKINCINSLFKSNHVKSMHGLFCFTLKKRIVDVSNHTKFSFYLNTKSDVSTVKKWNKYQTANLSEQFNSMTSICGTSLVWSRTPFLSLVRKNG